MSSKKSHCKTVIYFTVLFPWECLALDPELNIQMNISDSLKINIFHYHI